MLDRGKKMSFLDVFYPYIFDILLCNRTYICMYVVQLIVQADGTTCAALLHVFIHYIILKQNGYY